MVGVFEAYTILQSSKYSSLSSRTSKCFDLKVAHVLKLPTTRNDETCESLVKNEKSNFIDRFIRESKKIFQTVE